MTCNARLLWTLVKVEARHLIECITHADHATASQSNTTAPHGCLVATFYTFWPWPFDLILNKLMGEVSWLTIPVPSLVVLVLIVLVLLCRQTDRIPDSDDRYTRVTAVGVCNSPGDAVMFLFVRQTSNCSKYTACVICLMILLAYLWDCVTDCTWTISIWRTISVFWFHGWRCIHTRLVV